METGRTRPPFDARDAEQVVSRFWGIEGSATSLPGDRDGNFRIDFGAERYVLKFIHPDEPEDLLAIRIKAIETAARNLDRPRLPRVVPCGGSYLGRVAGPDGTEYRVLLSTWVEGTAYADFKPLSAQLRHTVGEGLALLDQTLASLEKPTISHEMEWDVVGALEVVDRMKVHIQDDGQRALVEMHMGRLARVADRLADLPRQYIHGDANDYNLFVLGSDLDATHPENQGEGYGSESRRGHDIGVIDFGDLTYTWRVAEIAVAGAYLAMGQDDPVGALAELVAGYHAVLPLTEEELGAISVLVPARLCISVCHSALRSVSEPDDPYQIVSQKPAWDLLEQLADVHPRLATYRIREACGLEPCPQGRSLRRWLEGQIAAPLFSQALEGPVFDLSVGTTEFDGGLDPTDAGAWTKPFAERLRAEGANIAFGRYLEPRICYRAEQFSGGRGGRGGRGGPERQRTIHLGVDAFAKAGTTVYAPFDGTVESAVDNDQPLDYGPTVILRHDADGQAFWTLYGHLSRESLAGLRPGMTLKGGEEVGRLGPVSENGGWPPHLHFQVYADAFDVGEEANAGRATDPAPGNLPGVAWASERTVWSSICPNPDLILRSGLPLEFEPRSKHTLVKNRASHLGPSLSVSYSQPLHIVRGIGSHLFDESGGAYLDGVNNVCHLGHAHPAVVKAASRQLSVLNTNTRYLHDNILAYAEALTRTLPDPLEVCFFVNSGSEANDLALRLAGAATGRRGSIVLESGYHGNLTSLVEVSSYKFDGPGGSGAPPHVAKARSPDPYRNPGETGPSFATSVADAARALTDRGHPPAAFLAESILSCGGQIVPPEGYLASAYAHARAAGALCIADEVQTGFGRVGSHMWSFQLQGVVPDIVTMGKPIGNGFPLGAVVTTRAIAEAFANGMEYFNTFGGNPVSCAVGLAVLDVIREDGLQAHAARVGAILKDRLEELKTRFPLIGDARGEGLFLGFELVRNRITKEPADVEASYLVNRMKGLGVLLSTDGPLHNVIKIKPPMVFSEADANEMADKLSEVLLDTCLMRPRHVS